VSIVRAQRALLDRLSVGSLGLAIHLETPPADWSDGTDAHGNSVLLAGANILRQLPSGDEAVQQILASAAEGHHLPGVTAVAYRPQASEALRVMWVADGVVMLLVWGERNSGKTQLEAGGLAGMAELHARAGYPLPLIALWLHSSLTNAKHKTIPSLQQPHWGGLWTFRDDSQTAVLTIGGVEMVHAHFVGVTDATSSERVRAEAHIVFADELLPSLDEAGGISARAFDLARNSARLPTRRRIAVGITNPADVDCWVHRRWIQGGGQPGCAQVHVSAGDRLTPAEVRQQIYDFADSPDLAARLGRGEWTSLTLGEVVAQGFDPSVHVVGGRLTPSPSLALAIGWDGGHSPSAVIGQLVGGQLQIFASLNDLKVGVLELIEDRVIGWLTQWAPWTRKSGANLVHVIDPSMATPGQATIRESAERTIRETLKGRIVHGPVGWSPRREAVLRVLAPRHEFGQVPLAISNAPETRLLIQALGGRWYYPQTPDGRIDRSRPKKPNSPHSDIGDAFAYLCGWLRPDRIRDERRGPRQTHAESSSQYGWGANKEPNGWYGR